MENIQPNVDLIQTAALRNGLLKKKMPLKKTIPYHLLGLLQQTMMIRSTDHHDLSVECQAQDYQIWLNKNVDLANL